MFSLYFRTLRLAYLLLLAKYVYIDNIFKNVDLGNIFKNVYV